MLIFQERVNIDPKMEFSSKTKLIICVRDFDYEARLELTEKALLKRMNELWHKVHPATTNRKMSDYIQVIVKDFPHKKEQKEFDGKCKDLAKYLWQFCTNGSQQHSHYASTFVHGSQMIWDDIRKNKKISAADFQLAMSKHMCEESKKEILGSFAEMKEYNCLMSGESMPVKEFNKKLQKFLTIITTRYEEKTIGIEGAISEPVKENLVKKTIKIFTPTFEGKIDSLSADTLSKANSEISDELRKISVLDVSTVTGAIRPYMAIFNENSRPDVPKPLKQILQEKQKNFAEELIEVAEVWAQIVEILRILATTGKIATKMTIGTAWGLFFYDPSLFVAGVVSSSRDIYKAVKRSRNKNERRICVDDIIDES
jgi:hypothetical protein